MRPQLSLHIGVNAVDPKHYSAEYPLRWCEADAEIMKNIAIEAGYNTRILIGSEATTTKVKASIAELGAELSNGGDLLVTFSGHGTRVPDFNGDETDFLDEAWVLYDRMLLDDEARICWLNLGKDEVARKNINVVVVSDCCYSCIMSDHPNNGNSVSLTGEAQFRSLSPAKAREIMLQHWDIYKPIAEGKEKGTKRRMEVSFLQLAACLPDETAREYYCYGHGAFTHTLQSVWKENRFRNYTDFHNLILHRIPVAGQHPDIQTDGFEPGRLKLKTPFRHE